MPFDPSIIPAIAAAVESSPDNVALRLHLATLLMDADRPAEALDQCTVILGREPDSREALRKAADAAFKMGDTVRAISYGRLLDALGSSLLDAPDMTLPPLSERRQPLVPTEKNAVPLPSLEADHEPGLWETERPAVTLSDVAGMEAVKRRLNLAFLAPMQNPDLRKLYGKSLRGGLLLYGPPGCGKTFIARATAGELGAQFLSVGLSDVLDMWIGNSEKNLHEIFETARRNRPCVLFFDEIDALGHKRSQMRNNAGRNVVNQLLAEMDSVNTDNEGVFILAATNQPWDIDTGLRRPGRLDRTLLVLPPDAPARESVLRLHSKDRPLEGVDFAALAAKTEDYSG
ncbi:MAG: AAA family ATPase, partial [Armatimonadota bacterium]|nr:AAA family ATPase [Armatimonadota bacterium]